jgi:ribosomal protein S1
MRLHDAANTKLAQKSDNQWMKLKEVLDRYRPEQVSRWETILEHYREGKPIAGRVVKTVLRKGGRNRPARLGYVVDIGTNAFLAVENAGLEHPSYAARLALVGQILEFDIIRLDEVKLQVDVTRRVDSDGQ